MDRALRSEIVRSRKEVYKELMYFSDEEENEAADAAAENNGPNGDHLRRASLISKFRVREMFPFVVTTDSIQVFLSFRIPLRRQTKHWAALDT
jgi:hypothetical protein